MRRMGGLKGKIPQTFRTMFVATLAISGIFPLAGFFSKDQILGAAFASGHKALFVFGLFTAGMTAFYMFRLIRMTFYGEFRGTAEEEHHLHESPATMTLPLWVLGILSCIAGLVGIPAALGATNLSERFLEPVVGKPTFVELSHGTEGLLMVISVFVALGGILWAWRWYAGRPEPTATGLVAFPAPRAFSEKSGLLGRLVADRWNVDEGIESLVLNPFRKLGAFLWRGFDALLIDGIVNASAFLVELAGDLMRFFTTGNVRNYALSFSLGVLVFVLYVWVR